MIAPDSSEPLGIAFNVYEAARLFGPEAQGRIVQHKRTGLMIRAGTGMSLMAAADHILRAIEAMETPKT